MKLKEIMTSDVEVLHPNDTCRLPPGRGERDIGFCL
jgi:hypothetical protein